MEKIPSLQVEPIDYEGLWRAEKEKARLRKQQQQQQQRRRKQQPQQSTAAAEEDEDEATASATAAMGARNSVQERSSEVVQRQLPSWDNEVIVPAVTTSTCNTNTKATNTTNTTNTLPDAASAGSLLECVCSNNPSSIYYQDNFLNANYQSALKEWLLKLPESESYTSQEQELHCWHVLPHAKRRVAVFFEDGQGINFPGPIKPIVDALMQMKIFPSYYPPNHILVNDYLPYQGIMAHTDGPSYFPITATISIGGDVVLRFQERKAPATNTTNADTCATATDNDNNNNDLRVLLSGLGSLIVFKDEAYANYMHSIEDGVFEEEVIVANDNTSGRDNCCILNLPPLAGIKTLIIERQHRISLTIRHKILAAEQQEVVK